MGAAILKSWNVPNIAQQAIFGIRATSVLLPLHMSLQQVDTRANKTTCKCNTERVESYQCSRNMLRRVMLTLKKY